MIFRKFLSDLQVSYSPVGDGWKKIFREPAKPDAFLKFHFPSGMVLCAPRRYVEQVFPIWKAKGNMMRTAEGDYALAVGKDLAADLQCCRDTFLSFGLDGPELIYQQFDWQGRA